MKPIEVSIRVPLGRPLPELAAFAARCERAGLDGVGVPDHHHTGRDAYLALSAMASATDRIALFPATSNVVTRPSVRYNRNEPSFAEREHACGRYRSSRRR